MSASLESGEANAKESIGGVDAGNRPRCGTDFALDTLIILMLDQYTPRLGLALESIVVGHLQHPVAQLVMVKVAMPERVVIGDDGVTEWRFLLGVDTEIEHHPRQEQAVAVNGDPRGR